MTATFEKAIQHPVDFLQAVLVHLSDLRWHILRMVIFLAVSTAFAFSYTPQIIDWLAQPLPGGGIEELIAIDVTEPVGVVMRVALLTGFSISLPYIALEFLLFAARGLKRRARIIGFIAIPITSSLFISGMAFAYYVMLPAALPVLLNFMGISTIPRPSSYISFTTGIMFWIGLAFQFPLVSFFLSAMGILKAEMLKNQWRLAIVVLSVLAAAITPTVDPVNMAIVLVPLLALYSLSIAMAYLAQIRRKKINQPE
jgi:sec-independent protein translocase protein TatC